MVGLLLTSAGARAQSYGLRFVGHEEIQDNRTSLELAPQQPLCFRHTFELSFDLSLVAGHKTYFGYIFRIIQADKKNLDLLYDQRTRCFKVVIGERFSRTVIRVDSAQLFNHWNRFRVWVDLAHQALTVYVNNRLIVKDAVPFDESGCFKIFFGGNEFKQFKSKDSPPMNLKDVALSEAGKQRYYWPLDERNGTQPADAEEGQTASVKNPVWIKALHNEWHLADQLTTQGDASVAFNPATETLYIVGTDALHRYSVRDQRRQTQPTRPAALSAFQGSQAIYNPFENRLYHFYVDQKAVDTFDSASGSWQIQTRKASPITVTEYWHANKFVARSDSSLYILGGYGQLTYKNSIKRYHFRTKQWDSLATQGPVYTPRYLAALGATTAGDTAYLIGGYGSLTGQQMVNPKSSYDLLQYVVKDNSFRKLYELNIPKTDFAFANSLVIDPKAGQFYGLIFPNQQFKSQLQLIRGSLTKPTYEKLGTPIGYLFHDINSFADLYYCPISQKLVAVTLYWNENKGITDAKIYTISFPPNVLESPPVASQRSWPWYGWLPLLGLIAAVVWYRLARRKPQTAEPQQPAPASERVENSLVRADAVLVNPDLPEAARPKAEIFFFGNFQVFDHAGDDITKAFTPLLKELFLLLALHSIGKKPGVPSERINEILWPDKSGRDAGNNRSVNLTKLRTILDKVGFCALSKASGYWKIEFDFSQVSADYERYIAIIDGKTALTKQTITELGEITRRGPFLQNIEYYWLDDFKADISNKLINTFLQYADQLTISDDPEFLIQISNFVFYYDPVNEDAIILKCKALALMGKHTLAKNAFEKFARDYKAIYGQEYEPPFSAIID